MGVHASSWTQLCDSSCTVYGNPEYTPLDEKHRLQVSVEQIARWNSLRTAL